MPWLRPAIVCRECHQSVHMLLLICVLHSFCVGHHTLDPKHSCPAVTLTMRWILSISWAKRPGITQKHGKSCNKNNGNEWHVFCCEMRLIKGCLTKLGSLTLWAHWVWCVAHQGWQPPLQTHFGRSACSKSSFWNLQQALVPQPTWLFFHGLANFWPAHWHVNANNGCVGFEFWLAWVSRLATARGG